MLEFYQIIFVFSVALAQDTCFVQTAVYGTKVTDSIYTSDIPYLRSSSFSPLMTARKLNVCGV